jgi:hypothetical protein
MVEKMLQNNINKSKGCEKLFVDSLVGPKEVESLYNSDGSSKRE